jgi:predicted DNA-binding mobile mystery protein A
MDRRAAREGLERRLAPWRDSAPAAPPRGWIRAVRDALGMSTRELAARAGVSAPRISQIERAEVDGSLTLTTLRRIAEALDCRIEYALVPSRPLDEMVREQARSKVDGLLRIVDHTMAMEGQRTDEYSRGSELERAAEELIDRRGLWSAR